MPADANNSNTFFIMLTKNSASILLTEDRSNDRFFGIFNWTAGCQEKSRFEVFLNYEYQNCILRLKRYFKSKLGKITFRDHSLNILKNGLLRLL